MLPINIPRFTPKTIVNYYLIAAAVFATAKDRKGKQLYPRQWDLNYIGLPAVDKKRRILQRLTRRKSKRFCPPPAASIAFSTPCWQGPDFALPKR